MKKTLVLLALACSPYIAEAENYLLSTKNTSLVVTANKGEKSLFQYYGTRIEQDDINGIFDTKMALNAETYPTFGVNSYGEKAIQVVFPDGNMSLDLAVESSRIYEDKDSRVLELVLKDKVYPFIIKQYFKAYNGTDVISTWVEVSNVSKKKVTMNKFSSAYMPFKRGNDWLTHFHGTWGAENTMDEELLHNGVKSIENREGVRNTQTDNPSFMLSFNGKADENKGTVLGATLAWSGNYDIRFVVTNSGIDLTAGINGEASSYILEPNSTFVTPEFAMSYSTEGKGGISRAFHKWALKYKLNQGNVERDILLNSWEGVYFKINQKEMEQMMSALSSMGGELFVMDDGWFGDKYPRNGGSTSLGDWVVCKEKLPLGIEGLLESASKNNIKFGIWIEPEMANTKSELFEKHPDWVLSQDNRPLTTGRGGTQVVLDMTNPDVQDFVFKVVDDLMSKFPQIAYIKWDANCGIKNYSSHYLPKEKQSQIYIDYHLGMKKVLERIRAKYPKLVMQACASGGGRINYGFLPYFEEFWTSDNTDALQRIYMQWGVSNFYPAIAMASHVSANKNHQTGRILPLKFRFDVAMSARLGMEIQPKDMSDADKKYAARAISAYKTIRPVVQFGNLYRLDSPYDDNVLSSLMYVDDHKDKAVFYAYKIKHFINATIPVVRMDGLDPEKNYKITDLTPLDESKPSQLNGKIVSGKLLMENGISLEQDMRKNEYSSLVLKLEAM